MRLKYDYDLEIALDGLGDRLQKEVTSVKA
jgi:hypothetical protein